MIPDDAQYLKALAGVEGFLISLEVWKQWYVSYAGHPLISHIRISRHGTTVRAQVISHGGLNLSPENYDEDPTQAFLDAWHGDGPEGYLDLSVEAAAILVMAVELECNDLTLPE